MAARILALVLSVTALAGITYAGENLILISVDTLRADHLACYGYRANSTPNFDRLARESILFERAFSEYPLTLPAHSTMLTGLYPFDHGVVENVGFRLDDSRRTLAEMLKANGYVTAGVAGSYVMGAEFGVAQGFDYYDDRFAVSIESVVPATSIERPAAEVTRLALDWLKTNRAGKFFLFLHYYDPHMPRPLGYDAEVTQVDKSLGTLLDYLDAGGLLADTHLILTSDHGEGLGEHGEEGHGFFIYDATVHVPLLVRFAGGARSGRVAAPVSLVDVVPTALELLGIPPPDGIQGKSLMPLVEGKPSGRESVFAETRIPELHFGWSALRSIRDQRYKYVDAPEPELYDLAEDPAEKKNLHDSNSPLSRKYQGLLESFLGRLPESGSRPVARQRADAETLERLAALGYVAPGGSRQDSGIDPKQRIAAFEAYHAILNLLAEGRVDSTILGQLDRLQVEAPEMRGVDYLRAWAWEVLGEAGQAVSAYQSALRGDPADYQARGRYARLLLRQKDYRRAEDQFLVLLRQMPDDYKSRNNLAGLYHMTGRTAEAIAEMEKIVSQRPSYAAAWQNLGQLYLLTRDYRKAENAFRRLVALTPGNPAGHLLLAQALAGQGRQEEAAKEAAGGGGNPY